MSSFTVVKLLASVALMGLLFERCDATSFVPRDAYAKDLKRTVRQAPFDFLQKSDQKADTAEDQTNHHLGAKGEFKIGLGLLDGLTFKGGSSIDYGSTSHEEATGKFKNKQSGGFLFPGLPIIGFTDMKEGEMNGRLPRDVSAGKRGNLKRSARSTGQLVCHGNIFQMTCYENNRIKRENHNAKKNHGKLGRKY